MSPNLSRLTQVFASLMVFLFPYLLLEILHALRIVSPIKFNNIIYCPLISKNLLSLNKLCCDNPYYVYLDNVSMLIKDRRSHDLIAEGHADGNYMYRIFLGGR